MLSNAIRRAVARFQLRRRKPSNILFICHGNLCRSPFAALVLRELTDDEDREFDVQSAGFQTEIPTPPRLAIEAASARGIDLSKHVAQSVSPALVRNRDLIVVMEPRQRVRLMRTFRAALPPILVLGDLDDRGGDRTIADPINAEREVFDAVYDRITRCVRVLAREVGTGNAADSSEMLLHIRNKCGTEDAAPLR